MSEARQTELMEKSFNDKTDCIQTISVENLNIQQGKTFSVSGTIDITSGSTIKLTFQTNSTHRVRFKPASIVSSADKITYNAYEGSSGNSGGTTLTPINRNRTSDYATDVVVKSGVTVTTNGTLINTAYIPGATGVGGTRTGSETGDDYGWILKPDTLYTLEFVNGSSTTNIVSLHMLWFENTVE